MFEFLNMHSKLKDSFKNSSQYSFEGSSQCFSQGSSQGLKIIQRSFVTILLLSLIFNNFIDSFQELAFAEGPSPQTSKSGSDDTIPNINSSSSYQVNTSYLSAQEKKLFDYLEIEKILLDQNFPIPSTLAWKSYARIYEDFVRLFCFETINLNSLNTTTPRLGQNCKHYLNKLHTYYPEHPYIYCAAKGLKSKECENSYLVQYIAREQELEGGDESMKDYELKIAKLRQDSLELDLDKFKTEYELAEAALEKEKIPENWLKLKSLISQKIEYECSEVGVSFVDYQPADFMKGGNIIEHQKYTTDDLYKEAYDLLHDPERTGNKFRSGYFDRVFKEAPNIDNTPSAFEITKDGEINKFKPNKFWRVRKITKNCYDHVLKGFQFNTALPASVCSLHGQFSPMCLNAPTELSKNLPIYVRKPKVEKPKFEMATF